MQELRRFARYWDLVANSGNFVRTTPRLWAAGSPFFGFLRFSQWLFGRIGTSHGIALARLAELVFEFLVEELGQNAGELAGVIWEDYQRGRRSDRPAFLLKHLPGQAMKIQRRTPSGSMPKRQLRRLS
jgi:hypothetical protein